MQTQYDQTPTSDHPSSSQQNSTSVEVEILNACLQIAQVVQFFVLGPRLILGVREYYAKLVAKTEEGNGIVSIVFQERVRITTNSGV
jgi:hypothetical protein